MISQPYYMIEFTAISCMFEIRVNDNPVITLDAKGQVSTKIPINHAISESGKQVVQVRILPESGSTFLFKGSKVSYHVQRYDVSNGFALREQFELVESKPVEKDSSTPVLSIGSSFDARIPYRLRDYWKKGKDIQDVENAHSKLVYAYSEIGKIIREGNYALFVQKIADREFNIATAMYLDQSESEGRIKRMVRDFENGFNHIEFPENVVVIYSAYGKKASLKRKNGDPALSFVNKEKKEQVMLDLEFYMPGDSDEFKII